MIERRASDRLVDGFTIGFAAWTLVCQAAIALALPFHALVPAGLVAVAGALAASAWSARRRASADAGARSSARPAEEDPRPAARHAVTSPRADADHSETIARSSARPVEASGAEASVPAPARDAVERHRVAWSAGALLVAALGAMPVSLELKWAALALYAVAAAIASCRDWPLRLAPRADGGRGEWAVLAAALAGAVLAAAYVQPNPDDSGYVNLVVAPVDRPGEPIFQNDTMHGFDGVGPLFPVYRLHSLEAGAAAIAWLSGLPADLVVYRVLPLVLGFLTVLAHARLARAVGGRWWPWILGIMLVLAFGTATGPFSGVRALRHGKASLLLVALPLVVAYAVDWMVRPSARRWLRLGAAQVAAIGLSATGLWAAPVLASATLAALWRPEREATRRLAIGLGASAYLVVVGLLLFPSARAQLAELPEMYSASPSGLWESSLRHGLGSASLQWTSYASVALAIPLAVNGLARRVVLALVLGCIVLLVNPWLAPWIAGSVTGATAYWRAFRVFPAQLCVAMVALAPLRWSEGRDRRQRAAALGATTALVGAIVLSSPRVLPAWPPSLDPFAQSPYEDEHAAARAIVERTAAGDVVLAPESVARWTTTWHEPPRPLVVRRVYLYVLSPRLPREEYARRLELEAYVAGASRLPSSRTRLAEALRRDRPAAVTLATDAPWLAEMRRTLARAGYRSEARREPRWELWLAPSPVLFDSTAPAVDRERRRDPP